MRDTKRMNGIIVTQTFTTQNGSLIPQKLTGDELVQDIASCISNILTTIPGQDRTRPEFGSRLYTCIDKPFKRARLCLISNVADAIQRWEKRVKLIQTSVTQTSTSSLHLVLQWELVE